MPFTFFTPEFLEEREDEDRTVPRLRPVDTIFDPGLRARVSDPRESQGGTVIPFQLGNIFQGLGNTVSGLIGGIGTVVGALGNLGRPGGSTSVGAVPVEPNFGPGGRPSGGLDLVGPPGFSVPSEQFTFQPATFSGAQLDRPFLDFGEVDLRSGLTPAAQREFLLSQAGLAIGQVGRNGRGRMSYKQFKAIVRDMGAENARRFMNLDETSFVHLLINPPKRRGKALTAKQARDARAFTCRVIRFNKAAGLSTTGTRRRAPCRPKKCA